MSKAIQFKNKSGEKIYPCPYYPVGSIYLSVNSTNPGTIFGGTWEQIKDRFLLACGSTYSNGSTGGEANHKLTINEMPSHNHTFTDRAYEGAGQWGILTNEQGGTNGVYYTHSTNETGGSQAHTHPFTGTASTQSHIQPSITCYMWKRTA